MKTILILISAVLLAIAIAFWAGILNLSGTGPSTSTAPAPAAAPTGGVASSAAPAASGVAADPKAASATDAPTYRCEVAGANAFTVSRLANDGTYINVRYATANGAATPVLALAGTAKLNDKELVTDIKGQIPEASISAPDPAWTAATGHNAIYMLTAQPDASLSLQTLRSQNAEGVWADGAGLPVQKCVRTDSTLLDKFASSVPPQFVR